MDVNYRYFLSYLKTKPGYRSLRVLDYGCGRGEIVALLRKAGIQCWGVDQESTLLNPNPTTLKLLRKGLIQPLRPTGRIPFKKKFDVIISNQVIEHVRELDQVLTEVTRALHPHGVMYHHFPTKDTIREGHIGIPFVHWFNRSEIRQWYVLALRLLGFGFFKSSGTPPRWTTDKLNWLDKNCYYRDYATVIDSFVKRHRFVVRHKELDYLRFRYGRTAVGRFLPSGLGTRPLIQNLFRRLGFIAVELVPIPTRQRIQSTPPKVSRNTLWRALTLATYPNRDYSSRGFDKILG